MRAAVFFIPALILLCTVSSIAADHDNEALFGRQHLPLKIDAGSAPAGEQLLISGKSTLLPMPVTVFYLNGKSSTGGWGFQFRYADIDGRWSDWQNGETHLRKFGRFWVTMEVPGGGARQVQYRVVTTESVRDLTIQIYGADVPDLHTKENLQESAPPEIRSLNRALDSIPRPPVIPRAGWGANPALGTPVPHSPYRATVHHTAMARCLTLEEGIAEMQFIQEFHQVTQGWRDIAYHYCIDDSGRIYEGTPEGYLGTHTGGANTGNIGISLLGLFTEETPTDLMVESCTDLLAALVYDYSMYPDSIMGHRDHVASTVCPGDGTYPLLEEMRTEVRRLVGFGAPYLSRPFPAAFAKDVDPATQIWFHLMDDEEGVDLATFSVWVQGTPATFTFTGTPADYTILPKNYGLLPDGSVVSVRIQVSDLAAEPDTLDYTFLFQTIAKAVITESDGISASVNGTIALEGTWYDLGGGLELAGMVPGGAIYAYGMAGEAKARISPNVTESGDYVLSIAMPFTTTGVNARYHLVNSDGTANDEVIEYNSSYAGQWKAVGNGPIYCEAGTPSSAYIELHIPDSTFGVLGIDGVRLQLEAALSPPAIPEMKYARSSGPGTTEIGWVPTQEGDVKGYRLYESSDGKSWGDPVADELSLSKLDTVLNRPAPPAGSMLYYRVAAVETTIVQGTSGPEPVLSDVSDTYGVHEHSGSRVLIVDAFDRVASWPQPQHAFVKSYGDALQALGVPFESCGNDAVQSGEVNLADYDVVLYFAGDDSDSDESLSAVEQFHIFKFLTGGGKLFISGSELGYDLARAGRPDYESFNELLKAEYVGDDAGRRSCEGAAGTVFEGLSFTFGEVTEDTYVEDYPDYVAPFGGSEPALIYTGSSFVAAVQYTGTFVDSLGTTAEGQLVYVAFATETIYPAQSRIELLKRVMQYFSVPVSVSPVGEVPLVYSLEQNYPNPFNPTTTIRYQLPLRSHVTLKVFGVLGDEIATLVDDVQEAGRSSVHFDATGLATGVYFYRLTAGTYVETRKMMIVK
ncbi:MAG: N-acetylmuramoyl-L-alanine amidase [Bacteroidota bacterium]